MAIRATDITKSALRAFGQQAFIDGIAVPNGIVFNHAPAAADPYFDDRGHDGPSCCLLLEDLETMDQWPLQTNEISTGSVVYRIVRHDDYLGEVTMFLRKAE